MAAGGIPLAQLPVIPNGVDLHRFARDPAVRCRTRERLGIPDWAPVVPIAARVDEVKDIPLFVRAAGRFARERPDAHFILCGAGMTLGNAALVDLLVRHVHQDRVRALGIQPRMAPLYNAADLVVLTSAAGSRRTPTGTSTAGGCSASGSGSTSSTASTPTPGS